MSSKLSAKESDLQLNSRFYSVLYKAIQYVAESEGYSLVLKTSDADLVWYHTEIDITDKVIARVKASNWNESSVFRTKFDAFNASV